MNQKNLIAILTVVIVILIGTIVYFAIISKQSQLVTPAPVEKVMQRSASSTANQRTNIYKNEKYGFEFQYPKTWSFNENLSKFVPSTPKNCGPDVDKANKAPVCLDSIFFEINPNEEKLSITKFFEKNGWKEGDNYKNLKERKIGNVTAYNVIMISDYDGTESEQFWVVLNDGSFFALHASYLDEEEMKIFNKMLETFRFTK